MYPLLRSLLFRLDAQAAHHLALGSLSLVDRVWLLRALLELAFVPRAPGLERRVMGLSFAHPLGLAAGFDKDARAPSALAALGFAHLELGTVTAKAQQANPAPNLFRLPLDQALINRLGFPNAGAAALAQRLRERRPRVPLGVSIGKSRVVPVDDLGAVVDDYLESFAAVRAVADFVVVNVSSPNTKNLRAMQRAESARALLSALLEARAAGPHVPVLLKVSPDLEPDSYDALLEVARTLGLDGVVATNTTIARDGLKTPAAQVSAIGDGGLSGPPLRERSRAMVRRAREALGHGPAVIGVGGISTVDDALAMLEAGADLLQVYTGFIYEGPAMARRICEGLSRASALPTGLASDDKKQ